MKTKTGQIIFLILSCIFLMVLTYIICGCEEEISIDANTTPIKAHEHYISKICDNGGITIVEFTAVRNISNTDKITLYQGMDATPYSYYRVKLK